MIAVDTSTMVAYFSGGAESDVRLVRESMLQKEIMLPNVVITELLSSPDLDQETAVAIMRLPRLVTTLGYWERAGHLRKVLIGRGLKAKIADTLIAQSCIDHDVPLLTRDRDFRHYAQHCGLNLVSI